MNLVLIPKQVECLKWDAADPRTHHLLNVLKVEVGSEVDFAVENGPRGKGTVTSLEKGGVELSMVWNDSHGSNFLPIHLLVGLSRPQTCRKILEQATSMGVEEFHFFHAEKGEPSYGSSSLWKTDEWMNRIKNGVEQAFASHFPSCRIHADLQSACNQASSDCELRIGLDNYEAEAGIEPVPLMDGSKICLAIGPERGWSKMERVILRRENFALRHMGERVLRVETAVVAALGVLGASSWIMDS